MTDMLDRVTADDDLALGIDAVDLEHLLCKVDADGGNCSHGRPSLMIVYNDHSTAPRCLVRRRPRHQKRHGLFVGYWGEAATGRGLISAGVATQGWKHLAGTHLWGERRQVLRYDLPNLRHAMA